MFTFRLPTWRLWGLSGLNSFCFHWIQCHGANLCDLFAEKNSQRRGRPRVKEGFCRRWNKEENGFKGGQTEFLVLDGNCASRTSL